MPAPRGGLVYHWRHGWVPRDHFAALAKAHGSKSGAAKIMDKHGIAHEGSAHPVTRTHPVGARVEARQPGIDHVTHGQVVGHTDTGMVQVQHTNRHGQGVVGIFNPSHTAVVGTGATTHEPHAAPHALKPGEHATVRGMDHMGQPITLTGKVTSNSPAAEFGRGRTTGGKPLRTLGIEREGASGMTRTDHVHVPDPSRGEVTRQSNAKALEQARRAAELRGAAEKKRAEADAAAGSAGWGDRAAGRLSPSGLKQFTRHTDAALSRSVAANATARNLEHKAGLAEARAKEAGRTRLTHEDVKGATHVVDKHGQVHEVVRVNAKSVTVKTPYSWTDTIPHEKIHRVIRATPAQIAAAKAKRK